MTTSNVAAESATTAVSSVAWEFVDTEHDGYMSKDTITGPFYLKSGNYICGAFRRKYGTII